MPSKSKAQSKWIAELYNDPHKAKASGMTSEQIKEWYDADIAKGTKKLPERAKKKKKEY